MFSTTPREGAKIKQYRLRLSPEEKQRLERVAGDCHFTVAQVLREGIERVIADPPDPGERLNAS